MPGIFVSEIDDQIFDDAIFFHDMNRRRTETCVIFETNGYFEIIVDKTICGHFYDPKTEVTIKCLLNGRDQVDRVAHLTLQFVALKLPYCQKMNNYDALL